MKTRCEFLHVKTDIGTTIHVNIIHICYINTLDENTCIIALANDDRITVVSMHARDLARKADLTFVQDINGVVYFINPLQVMKVSSQESNAMLHFTNGTKVVVDTSRNDIIHSMC